MSDRPRPGEAQHADPGKTLEIAAATGEPEAVSAARELADALRLALRWMGDPDDPIGTFEDIGDWFYLDTGYLRPGKSEPLECGGRDEERRAAWSEWTKRTGDRVRETCRAALARVDGKP